ncbi:hypothetical protein PG984_010585 [Apiospora sp. TS-2023a]
MKAVSTPNAWRFCLTLLLLPLCSGREPKTNTSDCHLKWHWIKWISEGHFDASQDCGDLSLILQAAHHKSRKKADFCSAGREHVVGYIRASIDSGIAKAGEMPEDCAIEQWWYEGKYPKVREAFCKRASRIYNTKDHHNRTKLSLTEPYHNVIHGPRSQCSRKLRDVLATIGDPDVAGPGVMASYVIQLLLLVIFSFSTLYRGRIHVFQQRAGQSFLLFYGTSMILTLSIAIASAVTFAKRRAASFRSDFHFSEVYEYRLLTLAPAFVLLPVLAAHTLHETRQSRLASGPRHLKRPRVLAALICLFCVVVIWVIWIVGDQGHQTSVQFVFGGGFDIHINDFLYQRAGNYTLAIAIMTTILPILGIISILFSYRLGVDWPAFVFRVVCILLALAEVIMLFCIRTMAITDGKGNTSETEVGFGQILACFTWFPVLFTLLSGMEFPGVDEATARAPQGIMLCQCNHNLLTNAA